MFNLKRYGVLLGVLWIGSAAAAAPLTDRQEDAGELGNSMQLAIPAAALALTYLLHRPDESGHSGFNAGRLIHMDGSPRHDFALALGRSVLITQGLKYAVNEQRPNGGTQSFPSGHTSVAFVGAEFIRKEYGWYWGVPAYLAAGYVGWSRVESREHYTHDVLAGAAIGILVNHDFREIHTRYGVLSMQAAPMYAQGRSVPALQFRLDF